MSIRPATEADGPPLGLRHALWPDQPPPGLEPDLATDPGRPETRLAFTVSPAPG